MIPYYWVVFTFRMLGIWMILNWLIAAPSGVVTIVEVISEETVRLGLAVSALFTAFMPLLIGVWLSSRAEWFADKVYFGLYPSEEYDDGEESNEGRDSSEEYGHDRIAVEEPALKIGSRDLQAVVLSVLGIWVLAYAVPDAVNWVAAYLSQTSPESELSHMFDFFIIGSLVTVTPLATIIARLIVGAWLFFRSYKLVDYWQMKMGQVKPVEDE